MRDSNSQYLLRRERSYPIRLMRHIRDRHMIDLIPISNTRRFILITLKVYHTYIEMSSFFIHLLLKLL